VARRVRTIAVSEDTYRMLATFKQRTGSATFEEAVRKAVELAKQALAAEALEHVKSKRLTEEEKQTLRELRAKLREEGVWLSARAPTSRPSS
jgi:predicted CopG family antitoxin